ncbi:MULTISPECIES: hypothetical protein [Sphingobium]|uniref:hypothetical protein n=1 Tax=Sphingobium TaxID=165695 RepID=UPI00159C1C6C|nr:hypothetical protein [Sphingobium sp. 15-1]
MKPLFLAAGSALSGAALASALFLAWPALTPDADDASPSAIAPATPEGVVALDPAQASRAGIHAVTLLPAQTSAVRHGLARALDISTLSAIQSEIVSARAALTASQADDARQRALAAADQSASTKAVEIARVQAVADRARLAAATQRVGLEYGPGLARLSSAALGDLVRAVAAGQASLIRVDFADGAAPGTGVARIGEGAVAMPVRLIGPAAAADTRLQSAGSLAIIYGALARELGTGRVLPASMAQTKGKESGVIVPRAALLRYQGGLWVYRAEPGGGYRRVELTDARAQVDGWFVRDGLNNGLKPGDRVAADGAAVLLSIERGGEAAGEDD